jgi:hypothetical protein
MTATLKTYSSKSNLLRALKAAGIDPETMNLHHRPEGWRASSKHTKPADKEPKRNGNCSRVWDITEAMPGARRKDVVAACVEAGIPLGTAKTQYQQWYSSKK